MSVALCSDEGIYEGGRELTARWKVSRVTLDKVTAIEVSILWSTEGKGDTDLHVHHFQRLEAEQIRRAGLADEQSLSCLLPATPLSYHGKLIRLRWCVRLRVFLSDGREIVTDQPFYLVAPLSNSTRNARRGSLAER
ncbi:MAG: hypothetical protein AAGJ83_12300 [Planctomycetota bacterium]